jgi:pantoate--beta-alanine ligase
VKILRRIVDVHESLESAHRAGRSVGLVPTMGAFHEGHLSLMKRARADCDVVIVSLFVNPAQFNDLRDLDSYPRSESRDAEMAAAAGVDLLFAPDAAEMYPPGHSTTVIVVGMSEPLEGQARGASHFAGVATIVAKLLNIVQPTVAYFGQKDAQQVLVVRKQVRDLDIPVRIEVCPTVREKDGLAMSSRNARLSAADRMLAPAIRAGLDAAVAAIRAGERRARMVEIAGRAAMTARGIREVEYFAAVSAATLEASDLLHGETLLAVAVRIGEVRLIDNELINVE